MPSGYGGGNYLQTRSHTSQPHNSQERLKTLSGMRQENKDVIRNAWANNTRSLPFTLPS
jgi:hypothetical protein